jgi:ABC-type uncharacterized transport system permease subunit
MGFTGIKTTDQKIQASNKYSAYKLIDTHREFFSKLPTGILMRGIDLLCRLFHCPRVFVFSRSKVVLSAMTWFVFTVQ